VLKILPFSLERQDFNLSHHQLSRYQRSSKDLEQYDPARAQIQQILSDYMMNFETDEAFKQPEISNEFNDESDFIAFLKGLTEDQRLMLFLISPNYYEMLMENISIK